MPGIDQSQVVELLSRSLEKGQPAALHVVSNSMAPLLLAGDQIQVKAVDLSSLHLGDIVVMRGPTHLVTHRYWGLFQSKGQSLLLTRGDRVPTFDQPWPRDALLGKVVARRRAGRDLSLQSKPGSLVNRIISHLVSWENRWFCLCQTVLDFDLGGWQAPTWLRGPGIHRGCRRLRYLLSLFLVKLAT